MTQIVFMVFEDISKPPGDGLEVQVHISPGVKSREMLCEELIAEQSPKSDRPMDLPIVINPSSTRFKRRTKHDIIAIKKLSSSASTFSQLANEIVPHSHPGTSTSSNIVMTTNHTSYDDSALERSKSDSTLPCLHFPTDDLSDSADTMCTGSKSALLNSLEKREAAYKSMEGIISMCIIFIIINFIVIFITGGGEYLRLVSVVEPLAHLGSVPIKTFEGSLGEVIGDNG